MAMASATAAPLADAPSAAATSSSASASSALPWGASAMEDATMRNALAFLALQDSESALVYALVHDPEFRLAAALTSNAQRVVDVGVVRALLQLFEPFEDQLRRFLALLMAREMVETLNWNELFRANSAATAIIREYTCDLGLEFLQSAFQDALAELWDLPEPYEVNPRLVADADALAANRRALEALASRLLTRVFDAAPLFPYQVAKIYRVMEAEMARLIDRDSLGTSGAGPRASTGTSSAARRSCSGSVPRLSAARLSLGGDDAFGDDFRRSNASLPRLSAISEDVWNAASSSGSSGDERASGASATGSVLTTTSSALSPAKEEFYVHLGGFLFLRFLCPALLMPHKLGLTPDGNAPSKALQRTLVLVAKLFQSLANNVEYGAREEYMAPFNAFLSAHRARLFQFYDQIGQQAQHDNRRESLILRSNLAPRISQLWTTTTTTAATHPPGQAPWRASTASASSGGAPYGLLGDAPLVASVEDALGVVQRWITTHLDALVKEVATNGQAKRKLTVDLAAGTTTTTTTTTTMTTTPTTGERDPTDGDAPGSISPVQKKTKKSSATSGPRPKLKSSKTLSPVPTLARDGDENDENDEEEERANDAATEAVGAAAENVAREDLERVIGHTVHRDIQLMRIYYSSLSQAGLQRLLAVNSDALAHEWTLHKSRHSVDVYKREDPSAAGCRAPAPLVFGGGFVEMKAHVEIRATPRQVFKYLQSLEKMAEWDDRAAQVRRVEPLDDAKVVVYRSHPKLSLWPAWLVKPRDSCDLHSFVKKTGRADTYAVLMESVPRPDVPTIKGTVRMSFATGGFLVEPGPVSETHGQTTKLTCVVNADFKGALPRVLAESICVRQVLSVRAVKLRLETARIHGQSSWV